MTRCRSFASKKTALECYSNDHGVNVVAVTEKNCALHKIDRMSMRNFSRANYRRRRYGNVKGGRGGGLVILVHNYRPSLSGRDAITLKKNELEHCSASLFPAYEYDPPLCIVGAFRPPAKFKD